MAKKALSQMGAAAPKAKTGNKTSLTKEEQLREAKQVVDSLSMFDSQTQSYILSKAYMRVRNAIKPAKETSVKTKTTA